MYLNILQGDRGTETMGTFGDLRVAIHDAIFSTFLYIWNFFIKMDF